MLPPGVYQHGARFRLRIYVGEDRRPGWHVFKAGSRDKIFKEWARYLKKKNALTMADLFERYLREETPKKAAATAPSDQAAMRMLAAVFGTMRPDAVKPYHVAQYIDGRASAAPVRGNREKALLSHVFTKARHWGILDINPCAGLQYRNPETPRTRYVTDEELRRALHLAPPLIRYSVMVCALTGLRRRDVLGLRWGDFGTDGLTITISKSRRRGAVPKRLLFVWTPALRKLHRRLWRMIPAPFDELPENLVFAGADGASKIPDSTYGWHWARFQDSIAAAGIERFQFKDIRAKHGTDVAERGGDATRNLAHSSASTTQRHYQRRPVRIT